MSSSDKGRPSGKASRQPTEPGERKPLEGQKHIREAKEPPKKPAEPTDQQTQSPGPRVEQE
jgi:hypothetical protein